ncbi:MAG: hypothetical protein KC506_01325, partial [Nanoarchaeota archaeon]|nr:hypothetical protein [Nanoarchaeota archaeon]
SKAFKNAALVCVMSTGMQKLYMDKYDLETYPLRHTFNHSKLEILPNSKDSKKKVFWGGAVYGINKASIAKFSGLLNKTDFTLELATNASRQRLTQFGVNFERVETSYYSNTNDYWDAILGSTCLLLALDKQEDTKIDFDEISTIFPTKAIEYMFSNIPILVICPEDYFLNRFFSENNCGLVVNDIDDETSIIRAMKKVAELDATVKEKVNNAKKIADKLFNPELVRKGFKELLEEKLLMLNHENKSTKV